VGCVGGTTAQRLELPYAPRRGSESREPSFLRDAIELIANLGPWNGLGLAGIEVLDSTLDFGGPKGGPFFRGDGFALSIVIQTLKQRIREGGAVRRGQRKSFFKDLLRELCHILIVGFRFGFWEAETEWARPAREDTGEGERHHEWLGDAAEVDWDRRPPSNPFSASRFTRKGRPSYRWRRSLTDSAEGSVLVRKRAAKILVTRAKAAVEGAG